MAASIASLLFAYLWVRHKLFYAFSDSLDHGRHARLDGRKKQGGTWPVGVREEGVGQSVGLLRRVIVDVEPSSAGDSTWVHTGLFRARGNKGKTYGQR